MTTGVVLSKAWKNRLEPQLGKLLVVSNPIEPSLEPPIEPRMKHSLLLLGRDDTVKGHDFAITLATHLRTEFPELTLTLTGRNQSEFDWIRCLGWVPEAEKNRLLQEASILLVPSGYEGQPMVILEALACGLPVCASSRILDVPKGVSVAQYSDVSAWAKQVAQVLNSPPSPATLLASSQPFHIKAIQLRWQEVYEAFSVH